MLYVTLPPVEGANPVKLALEHSLVSLSKWESIHEKAFYGKDPMTDAEAVSYIEQMNVSENAPEGWVNQLTVEHFTFVNEYINSKQTATWFRESQTPQPSSEIVTSELMYYWMIEFKIPFKPCDEWHINRLMTLIRISGLKQTKPKKMTRQQQAEEYRRLNAQRRQELGTSG